MDLAPFHLSFDELACRDAARTPYPGHWRETRLPRLAALFESLRAHCGNGPLRILSAYRTPEHNAAVGGRPRSQHIEGRALDVATPREMSAAEFHARVRAWTETAPDLRGLGYYRWGVHIDVRPAGRLVAWNGRSVGVRA